MDIDLELLEKICNKYGATLHKDKSGGFIFDNGKYQPNLKKHIEQIVGELKSNQQEEQG